MTVTTEPVVPRPAASRLRTLGQRSGTLFSGISAVGIKELRGRMRGKRAFVVLTFYLGLLALFAWMIYAIQETTISGAFGDATFASARIGQSIFTSLLMLETLLVVVLAPSFTAGAISSEREKQTLDLLAATPISTLAIVVGKLLSALVFLFLLIVASIPLTAIVFTFGGVAPDDVLRGYLVLFVTAIGLGSIGLFFSALVRRTQAATVLTYVTVLALTLGATFIFIFWTIMAGWQPGEAARRNENLLDSLQRRPPEALLWFNPFVAAVDVVCGTETTAFGTCTVITTIMDRPNVFGGGAIAEPAVVIDDTGVGRRGAFDVAPQPDLFGNVRDLYWPRSSAAWLTLSTILVLLSVQLVSPTRRWRPSRPSIRRRDRSPT